MMKRNVLLGLIGLFFWLVLACNGTQAPTEPPEDPVIELDDYILDLLVVAQQEVLYQMMPYTIESAAHVTHILPKETLELDNTYTDVTIVGIAVHAVIHAEDTLCKTFEKDLVLHEESVIYEALRYRSEACLGETFLNTTIYVENTLQIPGQPLTLETYHRFPTLGLIESAQTDSTRIVASLSDALLESATVLWQTHDDVIYGVFPNQQTVHVAALTEAARYRHEVTILDTIEGYPVQTIASGLFKDHAYIQRVTLPDYLTKIPNNLFRNAQLLTEITIPAQVQSIGDRAFSRTHALAEVVFASNSQLRQLGDEAFGWSNLSEIHLPKTLDTIGRHAFFGTWDLIIYAEHLSLPPAWDAEWNPQNQTVVWGYKMTIDNGVIRYATTQNDTATVLSLSPDVGDIELVIPTTLDGYTVIDIANGAFKDQSRLLSVHLPETLKSIAHHVFDNTENMTTVVIHENSQLTSIGQSAFRRSSIQSIHIPAGVTIIEPWAFGEAAALETVTFAENSQLEIIAHRAFSNAALQALHLPASLEEIGSSAFSMTMALHAVTFEAGSALKRIDPHAFAYSGIESIELPARLTHIEIGAFANTAALETVTFEPGSKLEYIGHNAFMMSALTRIDIPLSVTTIGEMAFFAANQLTIYTEHETKPSGWHITWNVSNRPVVWGHALD